MTDEEILREINSLPPEAQRQLEDFIFFLRERYKNAQPKTASTSDLESEAFVGMWRDHHAPGTRGRERLGALRRDAVVGRAQRGGEQPGCARAVEIGFDGAA